MDRIIDASQPLKGKKILLGVCASIAAYKAILLLRLLQKHGASVQVIMTPDAQRFVSPLTFSTLSQFPVFIDLWQETSGNHDWSYHVQLAQQADILLIAPATMNTIAKLAHGICDNALTATAFSAKCPIFIAPAMDHDMFHSPPNQSNLLTLQKYGYHILPTETGFLASGLHGEGRMLEPEQILEHLLYHFTPKILASQNLLINLGPTQEAIDPVRFISNHSSGKMGLAIALWAHRMGAKVTTVSGPISLSIPSYLNPIQVTTAQQMLHAMLENLPNHNLIICTAAVADFKPVEVYPQKIKKNENPNPPSIQLTQNPDILLEISKQKKSNQKLIGFALETDNPLENAKKKLHQKNLDAIVLNTLQTPGATFGSDYNKIWFVTLNQVIETELLPKEQIAIEILCLIAEKILKK